MSDSSPNLSMDFKRCRIREPRMNHMNLLRKFLVKSRHFVNEPVDSPAYKSKFYARVFLAHACQVVCEDLALKEHGSLEQNHMQLSYDRFLKTLNNLTEIYPGMGYDRYLLFTVEVFREHISKDTAEIDLDSIKSNLKGLKAFQYSDLNVPLKPYFRI